VECIQCVEKTYREISKEKINRIFITLQAVFNCVITNHGGNNNKIHHINKNQLEKQGKLPIAVPGRGN
jgi:hypothetical protein